MIWCGLLQTAMVHNKELFGLGVAYEPYAYNPQYQYFMPYFCRNGDGLKLQWLGSDSYRYFYLDWYQVPRELERPIWSEPYFDEGAGNIIMSTFSVPFYQETGGHRKLAGIVGADISLMWLKDIVSAVKIYQTGYAFLISQNGVFVTHPEKEWIMRESIFSLAEARNDPDFAAGGPGHDPGRRRLCVLLFEGPRQEVLALLRPSAVHRLVPGGGLPGRRIIRRRQPPDAAHRGHRRAWAWPFWRW